MKLTLRGGRKIRGLSAFFVVLGFSFTGCNASLDKVCRDFPAVSEEIGGMQTQIAAFDARVMPKRAGKVGRKIASAPGPGAEEILDRREAWMEWGEKALKRTQWAKDALEDDKRGRKAVPALNDAGLSLVSFHGFLEQEKWRKASAELERAEASLRRARKIACDAETPPKSRETRRAPAKAASKHRK